MFAPYCSMYLGPSWIGEVALREAAPFLRRHAAGVVDPLAFADAWRAAYQPSMEEVRSGRLDPRGGKGSAKRRLSEAPSPDCRASSCRRGSLLANRRSFNRRFSRCGPARAIRRGRFERAERMRKPSNYLAHAEHRRDAHILRLPQRKSSFGATTIKSIILRNPERVARGSARTGLVTRHRLTVADHH